MNHDNKILNTNNNIYEYDCLRIIATLLVVLGHSTYFNIVTNYGGCDYTLIVGNKSILMMFFENITAIIYIFHMPLFMALSGSLFMRAYSKERYKSLKQIVVDKSKRLLIPFLIVSCCYSFPLKYLSGYYSKSNSIIRDFIFGQLFIQGNTHLWYLATLFFIFIIAYIIEKFIDIKVTIKLLCFLFLCIISSKIKINIVSNICQYIFWFYIGFYFECIRDKVNQRINKKMYLVVFFATLILYCFCTIIHKSELFIWKIVFILVKIVLTLMFCLGTYMISYYISRTNIISTKKYKMLRQYSFGIYLYSDTPNYLILSIGTQILGSYLFENNVGALILYSTRFFGTLIISIIVTKIIENLKLKYLY
ncbi:acyltransferase family protein [Intestinibacter sp.]